MREQNCLQGHYDDRLSRLRLPPYQGKCQPDDRQQRFYRDLQGTRIMSQSATISSLIWSVADLLRGDYKPADYGKVSLALRAG